MRAGGKKNNNVAAAAELKVPRFINYNLKLVGNASDEMAGVFQGTYNIEYYKRFGLMPVRKKAEKIFKDLEKLEEAIKKTKYYDKDATSSR